MTAPRDDDGWAESTEGDLDPDLTEEAGYGGWEPPERGIPRWAWQAVAVVVILALVFPLIYQATR